MARQWLKSRPEKNIVLVTHGGVRISEDAVQHEGSGIDVAILVSSLLYRGLDRQ